MRRFVALLAIAILAAFAAAQGYDPSFLGGLKWRLIGPFRGGRALAVTGVPGAPEQFYFGAVGGGVWKTYNAGRTWTPIMDMEPVASIGDIALAPSDPNTVYVGSGEADMRSDIQQGNGMYKSTDAGKTWTHIGLDDTRQIGKILIDPHNADIVYVAALGHQYGPNNERGVFKTTDGGKTWDKILYKNPDVGAIDLAMDPADSNVIFAAMWQTRRPPWSVYPPSNGPGSGLFKSTDAGHTWSQVTGSGFPAFVGRVGITISPTNDKRIYVFADTNDDKTGGVYRSDDGGVTWAYTDGEARIWHRGWYFANITADPKNPDVIYIMNTSAYRSTDGGKSFTPFKGAPGGDDYHTAWIAPDDPNRMIIGSDQGVVISVDGGSTWSSWYNQPTGQFYHVITDNRFPYWVYGSQQDSGSMAVPSRTIHSGISDLDWRPIDVGGESDMIAADSQIPGLLLGSEGSKEAIDTAWHQEVDPTMEHTDTAWRTEWTQPIASSPTQPHVFYLGRQSIFRTADDGASWQLISPDLTRETEASLPNLDPTTASDDTGLKRKGVVYWIAPSPIRAHQLWAGTDDGFIWLTEDDGAHWDNVTPPELTPWSKIGVIDASHFDPQTAYAAIDRHRIDDNKPYIYRTHDGGKHWTLIANGLPESQFVNVVREDPGRSGLLYAGTDWGIFVSFDDGDHWQSLQLNLPAASIRDIVFQNGDIIVGTHGRAIWAMDDANLLEQLTAESASSRAVLFKPATACRFQWAGSDEGTPLPPEEPQAENPPWGAILDYHLAERSHPVNFSILDSSGAVIVKFSSADKVPEVDFKSLDIPAYWVHPGQPPSGEAGGHRFVWNLHDSHGLIVPPGRYTVQMQVDGKDYTQPLTVTRDPRLSASDVDLREQYRFALEIGAEIDKVREAQQTAEKLRRNASALRSPDAAEKLNRLLGVARRRRSQAGTPDEGETTSEDFDSLNAVMGNLGRIRGAVESAACAPIPLYRRSYAALAKKADTDIAELAALSAAIAD